VTETADSRPVVSDAHLANHDRDETECVLVPKLVPKLVHSGTYALYETPDGGRHLAYCPAWGRTEDGKIVRVLTEGAEDLHLPDIPPAALPLINSWLENGFPPAVLDMLAGKLNPMSVLKAMRNGTG
jgi:hypothetical protein